MDIVFMERCWWSLHRWESVEKMAKRYDRTFKVASLAKEAEWYSECNDDEIN